MAAPGPRVDLDIELRYAAVANGPAVCSGRPGRLSTVSPGPQPIQFCALVQDILAPKASAWYPIGWPFRAPDFVDKVLRRFVSNDSASSIRGHPRLVTSATLRTPAGGEWAALQPVNTTADALEVGVAAEGSEQCLSRVLTA